MIRQILLSLPTYPDRPPKQILEETAIIAQLLGASLTAHIPQLCSDPQTWPAVIGTFPLDFPQMMNEAVIKSEANATALAAEAAEVFAQFNVAVDVRRSLTTLLASVDPLIDLGRLHDLTILHALETDAFGRNYMQAAIFGTGHPTLLLPSGRGRQPLQSLNRIVVAWDFSREAARALADALPPMAHAKEVHILSVFGEKGINTTSTFSDLERYLGMHKVKYAIDRVTFAAGTIGDCVMSHAKDVNADLLVMGAYGHSRMREFILGGATRDILADTQLPVLLSH